jgi:hypothetical protein
MTLISSVTFQDIQGFSQLDFYICWVFLLNKPGSHNIAEKWLKMMIQTNVPNSQYIPTINLQCSK